MTRPIQPLLKRSARPPRGEPWDMTEDRTVGGGRFGWRLFHYLGGGGLKSFSSASRNRIRERRQNRFLALTAALLALWLVFMFA